MEDELEQEEQSAEEIKKPPKKSKKKPLMIIAIVLIQVIIAYILVVAIIKPKFFPSEENPKEEEVIQEEKIENMEFGVIHKIEKVTINLREGRRNKYLLTGFGLEVPNQNAVTTLTNREPQIRDIIIRTLRGKDVEDLEDVAYMDSIVVEIKSKVNEIMPPDQKVMRVFFMDYVIQ